MTKPEAHTGKPKPAKDKTVQNISYTNELPTVSLQYSRAVADMEMETRQFTVSGHTLHDCLNAMEILINWELQLRQEKVARSDKNNP